MGSFWKLFEAFGVFNALWGWFFGVKWRGTETVVDFSTKNQHSSLREQANTRPFFLEAFSWFFHAIWGCGGALGECL